MKKLLGILFVVLVMAGCTTTADSDTQPQLTGEEYILSLVDCDDAYISRGYGAYEGHQGVDVVAPEGTKIYAADDGVVTQMVVMNLGYGIHCVIQHESYDTLYAHCQALAGLKEGDIVRKGDVIGYVGNTGNSTGPHLHFEVIVDDESCDPVQWYK